MNKIQIERNTAKIGWIGTGIMGASMAMHLADAGYKISIYTRTRNKAEKLISRGCVWHDSPSFIF